MTWHFTASVSGCQFQSFLQISVTNCRHSNTMNIIKNPFSCHYKILCQNLRIMATPKQGGCRDCSVKCAGQSIDPAVLNKLEEGFKKLSSSNATSLLKKHLTKQVFDRLKNRKTSFGSTLLDCVQSGRKIIQNFWRENVVSNVLSCIGKIQRRVV